MDPAECHEICEVILYLEDNQTCDLLFESNQHMAIKDSNWKLCVFVVAPFWASFCWESWEVG